MPLLLATPEELPAVQIVGAKTVRYEVDMEAWTVQTRFAFLDAEGNIRRDIKPDLVCNSSLVTRDAEGNITGSRFTPTEYATDKAALYRIATEDGFLEGEVA